MIGDGTCQARSADYDLQKAGSTILDSADTVLVWLELFDRRSTNVSPLPRNIDRFELEMKSLRRKVSPASFLFGMKDGTGVAARTTERDPRIEFP